VKEQVENRRDNMKSRVKIAIVLVALLITFIGFNLIASESVLQIFNLKEVRGEGIRVTVTAGQGSSPNTTVHISG
jgi:hypothetical protein